MTFRLFFLQDVSRCNYLFLPASCQQCAKVGWGGVGGAWGGWGARGGGGGGMGHLLRLSSVPSLTDRSCKRLKEKLDSQDGRPRRHAAGSTAAWPLCPVRARKGVVPQRQCYKRTNTLLEADMNFSKLSFAVDDLRGKS